MASSSLKVGYGIASRLRVRGCTPCVRRIASYASSAFRCPFQSNHGSSAKLKRYSAVLSFNNRMGLSGIRPDVYTLNIIINCFFHLNQMGFGLSVLGKFFKLGFEPNEMTSSRLVLNVVTYNTLMDGFCKVGRIQDAQKLFTQMQACGHLPDVPTCNILLDGLCKNQELPMALKLFREMVDKKLDPNIWTYNILIQGLCIAGKVEYARDLFRSLSSRGLQPDTRTYNIMIGGFCNGGLTSEAKKLLKEMEEKGCSPDDCTYNIIIRGFFNNNEPSEAMGLIQQMVGKENKGIASFLNTNCFAGDEIQQIMLPEEDVLSWTLM
ncbi:unnamed protein product [Malus baccata var. baccata]